MKLSLAYLAGMIDEIPPKPGRISSRLLAGLLLSRNSAKP